MLLVEYRLILPRDFRDFFSILANQKQKLPMAAMFVDVSCAQVAYFARTSYYLARTTSYYLVRISY